MRSAFPEMDMNMLKPELVIFDCDGVLVDSEWLASKIEAKLLNDAGLEITAEEIGERYSGLTWKEILLDVEKNSDIVLSASMIDQAEKAGGSWRWSANSR